MYIFQLCRRSCFDWFSHWWCIYWWLCYFNVIGTILYLLMCQGGARNYMGKVEWYKPTTSHVWTVCTRMVHSVFWIWRFDYRFLAGRRCSIRCAETGIIFPIQYNLSSQYVASPWQRRWFDKGMISNDFMTNPYTTLWLTSYIWGQLCR